jgi:hypothetical protein
MRQMSPDTAPTDTNGPTRETELLRGACKPSFVVRCVTVATLIVFGSASTAMAASMELTVGPEPAESITTQLGATVSGANSEDQLWVRVKPSGGEGCAANPTADKGEQILVTDTTPESNPYSTSTNHTFQAAGSYLLCGWLVKAGSPETSLVSTSTTIPVRRPHLSLSISVPPRVLPGQTFQIATTAQAETSRQLWEYLAPYTGDPCPANAAAAARASGATTVLGAWNVTGGPFTESINETLTSTGTYLICAYFEYPERESAPEAATSAQTIIASPPPPCVVPKFRSGASLASVEQKIRAAHCTVGKISSAASTTVPRGGVVSLSPAPGKTLTAGTAVRIVTSAGRPCIVPVVRSGTSLAQAERQIVAADCTVSTSRVSSRRVRHGRVVGVAPRPHTRLAPRARVKILISAGHGHAR